MNEECISDDELAALQGGRLSSPRLEQVQAHLQTCADCRARREGGLPLGADEPDDIATRDLRGRRPKDAEAPKKTAEVAVGTRIGRYVIERHVGEGGMGAVYQARDPDLDRKVALKLLLARASNEVDASQARSRLLREAQALARLSHPNVVAIYDVGTFEDQVFIAMELVEGDTVKDWLKARPRSVDEIVQVFAAAAEGLHAAHRASLIHRDFKPSNVLVGNDGRVRVLDFGLARGVEEPGPLEPPTPDAPTTPHLDNPLASPLTRDGMVSGTVGYIAPEQLLGREVDARVDQFAFAVSLYEALYGARPFRSTDMTGYLGSLMKGPPHKPPAESKAPAWLFEVVRRALSTEPAERFPDMRTLAGALANDPRRRRRRWLLASGATVGVLAAAASVGYWASHRGPGCEAGVHRLDAMVGPEAEAKLSSAFAASKKDYANDVLRRVRPLIDSYASAWKQELLASCAAARVSGEQTEHLRRACLENEASELGAVLDVLSGQVEAPVDSAIGAVRSLATAERCRDSRFAARSLLASVAPERREQAQQLRVRLGVAQALNETGKYLEAADRARATAEEARALNLRGIEAQALGLQARVLENGHKYEDAFRVGLEALTAAQAAPDDDEIVWAATLLARRAADDRGSFSEAEHWLHLAQTSASTLVGDVLAEGNILNAEYVIAAAIGDSSLAAQKQKKRWELYDSQYGPENMRTIGALVAYASALGDSGQESESVDALRKLAPQVERTYGPQGPKLALIWNDLAYGLVDLGQYAEAVEILERCIRETPRREGPVSVGAALCHSSLPYALARVKGPAEALATAAIGEQLVAAAHGTESYEMAGLLTDRGRARLLAGDPRGALADCDRAFTIFEQRHKTDHFEQCLTLVCRGQALDAIGEKGRARADLERAAKSMESSGAPSERAQAQLALAQVLGRTAADVPRAKALATAALETLAPFPGWAPDRASVERWLKTLPTGAPRKPSP